MEIPLHSGSVYNLYALANMGDQTGRIPSSAGALLAEFTYTVPSYSDVNSRGIPMTGRIEYYTTGRERLALPRLPATRIRTGTAR